MVLMLLGVFVNNLYINKKSLFLSAVLLFSLAGSLTHAMYPVFEVLGAITDPFITKGHMDQRYRKLFKEVAQKMGVDDRDIKLRNSGLLMRLARGYWNTTTLQRTNRVYANQDVLEKMSDEEIKYIFARELAYHKHHHGVSRFACDYGFKYLKIVMFLQCVMAGVINENNINTLPVNYIFGSIQVPFLGNVISGKLSSLSFGLTTLVLAQLIKKQKKYGDRIAVEKAGVSKEAATSALTQMYNPQVDEKWPLYARFQAELFNMGLPVANLPIIKQHAWHLTSLNERVDNLYDPTVIV